MLQHEATRWAINLKQVIFIIWGWFRRNNSYFLVYSETINMVASLKTKENIIYS